MTTVPDWLRAARGERGLLEIPGPKHHPRVLEYHACTRLGAKTDEVPWCASFVCWCLEQAHIKHTRSAAASSYATFGVPCELRPGAIVVFGKADPDAGGTGHVAFAERWNARTVWVLGGNQNNAVNIAPRPRSRIVAVRWPVALENMT